MEKYICGIDIGTTTAKVGIFDFSGQQIASGRRDYSCSYPKPGWVEQDIEIVIAQMFEACKEAVHKSGLEPEQIVTIALSTQRTTSIFLDENEHVLKTISWQDNRANEEMREIQDKMKAEVYYQKTGLPLNTTWVILKTMWVQRHEPALWEKVRRVVQVQDYALRKLGADEYYVDYPDACLFGCFDQINYTWDDELMKMAGLTRELLPIPTPCATLVGAVSTKASALSGFCEGTPICVGAGDQNSASIGAGIIKPGLISVSIGTGGMAIGCLGQAYRDKDAKACVTCHAITGQYQFEGYQTGAASVFRWFRDELAGMECSYEEINQKIEQVPPGAKGLVMLPYLASATSPRWNSYARGTILGLTFAHDKYCIARACMEGITMEQKDILYNMKYDNNIPMESVRIIGGAVRSRIWNQIQADMYGLPCMTLKITDSAVLGAAIMAGVAIGVFEDISTAVENMVHTDEVYLPQTKNEKLYNQMYEIYCQAYLGLQERGVFKKLTELQETYSCL